MTHRSQQSTPAFRFFFDGGCPLCTKEVRLLQCWDTKRAIQFIDLTNRSEMENFPSLDIFDAMQSLCVIQNDGTTFRGIDATYVAWAAVGKGGWVKPLRWRWFRPVAQAGYAIFARYRHGIAMILTGKARVDNCALGADASCRKNASMCNTDDAPSSKR